MDRSMKDETPNVVDYGVQSSILVFSCLNMLIFRRQCSIYGENSVECLRPTQSTMTPLSIVVTIMVTIMMSKSKKRPSKTNTKRTEKSALF
jgi:hypothetical protein